jgi:hypothetical protein
MLLLLFSTCHPLLICLPWKVLPIGFAISLPHDPLKRKEENWGSPSPFGGRCGKKEITVSSRTEKHPSLKWFLFSRNKFACMT